MSKVAKNTSANNKWNYCFTAVCVDLARQKTKAVHMNKIMW